MANEYTYANAGFDSFMNRSIDMYSATNLDSLMVNMPYWQRQLPMDTVQSSGSLGDSITIGSIILDGVTGRISVEDQSGNEVVRLGEIS